MKYCRIFLLITLSIFFLGVLFLKKQNNNLQMETNKLIRNAAKAGTWYSASVKELNQEIEKYLNQASVSVKTKPRIIMVPHPGLKYGGPTAAHAFKAVSNYSYRNIFLLAVSHYEHFTKISVGDYDFYESPGGKIPVNRDISSFLLENENFTFFKEAHEQEHSNEMQLPFLNKVFSDFKIVPIILPAAKNNNYEILAETLYQVLTEDDLIIISSDLSHYPNYENANYVDKKTLEAILTLEVNHFTNTINSLSQEGVENVSTLACGAEAIKAGVLIANKLNLEKAELLHYENSGDNSWGDKDQVVGYGALAVFSNKEEQFSETLVLSTEDKKTALKIVRTTLQNYFKKEELNWNFPVDSVFQKKIGAFVTLKKNHQLRGCIGNFDPSKPLFQIVEYLALEAALHDPRFPELREDELEEIDIEISLLSERKKIFKKEEIIPGKHGVYLRQGLRGGTYLPQVAIEQNWEREAMMNSLCEHKSGLDRNAWKDGSAEMFTYTALVFGEDDF